MTWGRPLAQWVAPKWQRKSTQTMVLLVILFDSDDAPNNVLGRMMLSTRATPGVHAVGSSELTRVVGAAVVQPMMLLMHHKS